MVDKRHGTRQNVLPVPARVPAVCTCMCCTRAQNFHETSSRWSSRKRFPGMHANIGSHHIHVLDLESPCK